MKWDLTDYRTKLNIYLVIMMAIVTVLESVS